MGDQVFYQSGGYISHTGIVVSVNDSTFTTIEGNTSEQVKRYTRKMNAGYTYSFGRPKYYTATSSVQYSSANATSGSFCNPGKVKITAVYASSKPPYHTIAEAGNGSTVYGWVDTDKLSTISEIEIGNVVQFKGGTHYTSSNVTTDAGPPKAIAAKVTSIANESKHSYHLVHTDKQSTIYS